MCFLKSPNETSELKASWLQFDEFIQTSLCHSLTTILTEDIFGQNSSMWRILMQLYLKFTGFSSQALHFYSDRALYYPPLRLAPKKIGAPWAHLLIAENSYLERALGARENMPDEEKYVMYHSNAFENVKKYLVQEYKTLNKVTVNELVARLLKAVFHFREMQTTQVPNLALPQLLLNKFSEYTLFTNEVMMVIEK
jgi:hypothetical protein